MAVQAPYRRLGANEPCWCGSGLKYKRCHRDTDQRQAADEIKQEVSSPKHGHLDARCDSFHPHTHTAAITQPAFHHKLGLMRREGATILHVAFQEDLGREPKLFDAALAAVREKSITPHFWSDPSPEELALGQRLADRLFGEGAITLRPSGEVFGQIGKSRIQRGPEGLIGQWGREGGLGQLLLAAMVDDKEREGFNLGRQLLRYVAVASLLEDLEEAAPVIAEWRFPYENEKCRVEALKFSRLLASTLGDPHELSPESMDASAVGVGLWLAGELGRPMDEVVERHRFPDDVAAVLAPYWTLLGERKDLTDLARAAGDDWRRPESANAWGQRTKIDPEPKSSSATLPVENAMPPLPPAATGAFSLLDSVRDDYQQRREEIGLQLKAIGEQRTALDEEKIRLQSELRRLAGEDAGLAERALEIERRQVDFEPQERNDMAAALLRIFQRATDRLRATEQKWPEIMRLLESRTQSPRLDEDASFLIDLRRQRENGAFSQLPVSIQRTLEQRETQAREVLGSLPSLPATDDQTPVPIVFATGDAHGHIRLEVLFPRFNEHRAGSLQAELDEAVVAATRLALAELNCSIGTCRVEAQSVSCISMLAVSAEGDEASSEIVKIAFDDSFNREQALLTAGLRFEVQAVGPELLDAIAERTGQP